MTSLGANRAIPIISNSSYMVRIIIMPISPNENISKKLLNSAKIFNQDLVTGFVSTSLLMVVKPKPINPCLVKKFCELIIFFELLLFISELFLIDIILNFSNIDKAENGLV